MNLFRVFEVIYDTGNLTLASEILNVTQPAVSNSLARLRDHLDDPLFVRAGKRMNPTPTADQLIVPVRKALRLLEGGVEKQETVNPLEIRKTLRISIGDVGEAILLPRLVAGIRAEAPGLTLQAYQMERRQISRKLAANDLDFAIDIPMPIEGQLRRHKLIAEKHVCAMSKTHALAGCDALSLEDYLREDHVHVSSRKKGGGVADLALSALGKSRNNVARLQHYQAAFSLLAETPFLLTAPLSLARQYPCRIFELPFAVQDLELQLYWHASSEQSAANNWIRERIVTLLADKKLFP
ncbi:MAG: LysR family transcriptional regulator [Sneathiellales bacterium]|nr:LysR family transcriptional regulator [Sneathiellales bacterium]